MSPQNFLWRELVAPRKFPKLLLLMRSEDERRWRKVVEVVEYYHSDGEWYRSSRLLIAVPRATLLSRASFSALCWETPPSRAIIFRRIRGDHPWKVSSLAFFPLLLGAILILGEELPDLETDVIWDLLYGRWSLCISSFVTVKPDDATCSFHIHET